MCPLAPLITPARAVDLCAKIGQARVAILGDIMLDEYLFGAVNRISPEAPVPVVEVSESRLLLGGAANVAANIRSLGDQVDLIAVVGDDEASIKLSQLLKERRISAQSLITDTSRQTTIKTRIIAHSQQVVRADRETPHELSDEVERRVVSRLKELAPSIKGLIISDYGKGVITASLLESVMAVAREHTLFVAVDPKESHFFRYQGVSIITPNHHEAGFAYGRRIQSDKDLYEVGFGLIDKLKAESILITRGARGMSLFERGKEPTHIPTFAREVYDVTGAGDTVIAVLTSAICAGASRVEAAVVANAAAGYTVSQVGAATVSIGQLREELRKLFEPHEPAGTLGSESSA